MEDPPRMEAHILDGGHFLLETHAVAAGKLMRDFASAWFFSLQELKSKREAFARIRATPALERRLQRPPATATESR
jgi:hypothetical protein